MSSNTKDLGQTEYNRFVVIDDDHLNNMLCSISIRKQKPESLIFTFTDPEEGLAFLQNETKADTPLTVVFLDINMPSMSGWEFMDVYNKIEDEIKCKLKVYFLTSSVDQRDLERAANHREICGLISKPLKLDKVFS